MHPDILVLPDNHAALAGAAFDQPPTPLKRFILVAATERSGSNMLCRILKQLGFGIPIEYYHPRYGRDCARRWGVRDGPDFPVRFLKALVRHRTVGGHCAVKCFPAHWPALAAGLAGLGSIEATIVHLWRRDTLAQTISLRLALRSGVWSFTPAPTTAPDETVDLFDLDALSRTRKSLLLAELGWRAMLRKQAGPVVHLAYEDMVADREREVRRLVRFLDPGLALSSPLQLEEPLSPAALHDRQPLTPEHRRGLREAYEARFGAGIPLPDP